MCVNSCVFDHNGYHTQRPQTLSVVEFAWKETESEQQKIKVSVSSGVVVMDKGQGPVHGREINPSISRLIAEHNKMDSMSKAGWQVIWLE